MNSIIRAWKDPVYRAKLSDADRNEALQSHPSGMIELTGTDLDAVSGGGGRCKSKKSSKSSKSSKSRSGKSRSGKSSGKH